jgi:DNA-binding MarR family transcriptional regulator
MLLVTALRRVADKPTWLLSSANARSQGLLAGALAAEGVRGYHFRVLAALDEHGPASQADVGRWTGIDRSDVVAIVDDLVARGLARREPDLADRRRNVITISKRGSVALERLDGILEDVQDAVLAPLTVSERRTLVRLLRKLT